MTPGQTLYACIRRGQEDNTFLPPWEQLVDRERATWDRRAAEFVSICEALAPTASMRYARAVHVVWAERVEKHKAAIDASGPIRTEDIDAAVAKQRADGELWAALELGA